MYIRVFIAMLLCSWSLYSDNYSVPFTELANSENYFREINKDGRRVLVISGTGPAGLLDALVAAKKELFDYIVIVEKREFFKPFDTVTIDSSVIKRLEELSLLDRLREIIIDSPSTVFHFDNESIVDDRNIFEPREIDFNGAEVEIARLQKMLADEVIKDERIVLLHGHIKFTSSDGNFVQFTNNIKNVYIINNPSLIVVAEGVHSQSREQLGIETIQKRETEL